MSAYSSEFAGEETPSRTTVVTYFEFFSWRLNNSKKGECAEYNKNLEGHCFLLLWNMLSSTVTFKFKIQSVPLTHGVTSVKLECDGNGAHFFKIF